MKTHNGMRPQDIAVLLKILLLKDKPWQYRDLAFYLFISVSEVSESLHRSHVAGLVDDTKRKVYRQSLMEFIRYGLHYVFPQLPGPLVTGLPTAHSHPHYRTRIQAAMEYVWPEEGGSVRGLSIQPLYAGAVKAARIDENLHRLLASVDILRVGRPREIKLAIEDLEQSILDK